jgi:hypothetical protein
VANLSRAEQRKRVRALVRRKHGVDCPELDYMIQEGLGPAVVNYQCTRGGTRKDLTLTEEEARYLGLDRNVYGPPETGGY